MKMTVFWDVAQYSLKEVYRRFRGDDQGLMMEVGSTSETSVNSFQSAWRATSQNTAIFLAYLHNQKKNRLQTCMLVDTFESVAVTQLTYKVLLS
jgi:hypothetical protein